MFVEILDLSSMRLIKNHPTTSKIYQFLTGFDWKLGILKSIRLSCFFHLFQVSHENRDMLGVVLVKTKPWGSMRINRAKSDVHANNEVISDDCKNACIVEMWQSEIVLYRKGVLLVSKCLTVSNSCVTNCDKQWQTVIENKKLYSNFGHCRKMPWQTVTNRDKASGYSLQIVGIYRKSVGK